MKINVLHEIATWQSQKYRRWKKNHLLHSLQRIQCGNNKDNAERERRCAQQVQEITGVEMQADEGTKTHYRAHYDFLHLPIPFFFLRIFFCCVLCFVTLTISFMQHNFHYLITIKPHTNAKEAEKKLTRRGNGFRLKLKMRHSHDLLTIARSRMWNCNCKTPVLFNYDIFKRRTIAR